FFCCSAECLLLSQSGHPDTLNQCPLLGVKRTSVAPSPMSAFDPKRTWDCLWLWRLLSHGSAPCTCYFHRSLVRSLAGAVNEAARIHAISRRSGCVAARRACATDG